jgi:hypothetical protein
MHFMQGKHERCKKKSEGVVSFLSLFQMIFPDTPAFRNPENNSP